jgi:hypothetical protein
MDNKKLIKFYKGYVLESIQTKLNETGIYSTDEVDAILKHYAGFDITTSCKDLTTDELQELISWSFQFGDSIGLELNYKGNEWIKTYDK